MLDAGTGVSEILLDLALCDKKPKRVIIVDAMDNGEAVGTILAVPLEYLHAEGKRGLFAHEAPNSILLEEVEELKKVEVTVLTVSPGHIPQGIRPGLTPAVHESVAQAHDYIVTKLLVC